MESATTINQKQAFIRKLITEIFLVVGLSFLISLYMFTQSRDFGVLSMYIPYAYFLYAINTYYLLRMYHHGKINKTEYGLLAFFTALAGMAPFILFIIQVNGRYSQRMIPVGLVVALIVIPLSMYVYFRTKANKQQIASLQKDLGKTTAEMKLMQSQINPHFLFNVMNSIYGIAMQENADKTADSIQRLSQMMRFMLFENQQDYILLSRDLDYLREYVAIQSLRVENVPNIKIESEIADPVENFYISPMLLIPFVENAFKHGISMEKESWIKINADIVDRQLKFSVYNSIHQLEGTDLERSKSGIGLDNVQARLQVFYPGKHLLVIEQNQQEFFVFLTVDLLEGQPDSVVDINNEYHGSN
ncbi:MULTISPECIES: sensor histidine kinase [unclassified Sphingobacterium]|uniref:sensor histidine kinase n=1 Tax=unclassified Sphingobacterium TaxID=2609468 RepID=UPI001431D802|nr:MULTISPECIES: histidine kinase [unclassified Sphingobacterium]